MTSCTIYVSEIAKLIRSTKFAKDDIANTFETIWKRNNSQNYRSNNARRTVYAINREVEKAAIVIQPEGEMTIDHVKQIGETYETLVNQKEQNEILLTKSKIASLGNDTEQIKEVIKQSSLNVGEINDKNVTQALDIVSEASLKDKKEIIKYYQGAARKALGTHEEYTAQQMYELNTGDKVKQNNAKTYSKRYKTRNEHRFEVRGRIDGIVEKGGYTKLIEIKNRSNRLFKFAPEYERIQIMFYLHFLKLTKAELVERLGEDINIIPVNFNEKLYIESLRKLSRTIDFMVNFWTMEPEVKKYHSMTLDERKEYLLEKMP